MKKVALSILLIAVIAVAAFYVMRPQRPESPPEEPTIVTTPVVEPSAAPQPEQQVESGEPVIEPEGRRSAGAAEFREAQPTAPGKEMVPPQKQELQLESQLANVDNPALRRYVLGQMLKDAKSVGDLENLGLTEALGHCKSYEQVYDILRVILESDQPWARDFVVKIAGSSTSAVSSGEALALLLVTDAPWARESVRQILESAEDESSYTGVLREALDARTPFADKLCRDAYLGAPPEVRAKLAGWLLSEWQHFGGNFVRKELFQLALVDPDPSVVREAVGFLIGSYELVHPDTESEWTSELLMRTFDRADHTLRIALLDGARQKILSNIAGAESGSPGNRVAPFPASNITAVNNLLERALNCNDVEVRAAAEDLLKNVEEAVDAESVRESVTDLARQLGSLSREDAAEIASALEVADGKGQAK